MNMRFFLSRHFHSPIPCRAAVVAVVLAWSSLAYAQSGKSRSFLGGQLSVDFDFQAFENNSFTYTPVQALKKGDAVAAMVSEDQAWSVDTAGDRQRRQDEKGYSTKGRTSSRDLTAMLAECPVVAMVKTSDGNFHSLYPAILKAKTDIKAGNVVHSDGYQIQAERSVKAGESISVLVLGDAILSIEAAPSPSVVAHSKPWFTAFKDDMKPNDHASAIEAWRTEKQHITK
jgi:hypothetical protein